MTKDIVEKIKEEINEGIKKDVKLCDQEQDPVEKTKLVNKMGLDIMRIMFDRITTVSDKEFLEIYKEMSAPIEKQYSELIENEKNIAFSNSKKC